MDCGNGAAAAGEGRSNSEVSDLKEQILQLAWLACHEEEEKSRTELLEKLRICSKHTLVDFCRSFDIIGSTANKKHELVEIVMEYLMEYCSNPNKKFKKRRRMREEEDLSGCKPLKKKKLDQPALESLGEAEADGRKSEKDRTNYSEFDLKDNRYEYAADKKGQFPKEEANTVPSERVNGFVPKILDGVALTEVPVPTNEEILAATHAKLVSNIESDNTSIKVSRKKNTSITKKKATTKTGLKNKPCGKKMSGDVKPRKHAVKPSRDELRQAVFIILDTANFATMTFGDIVKQVDKYFGKDLFERKPLIRSLIEEELFRLAEEAEKKELEEEAAAEAEAKARIEQDAKERAKDGRVDLDIVKGNELEAGQDHKSMHATLNENGNSTEKGVKGGISVNADEYRNSNAVAESSQNGKAGDDVNEKNSVTEFTKDGSSEKIMHNANGDDSIEACRDSKAVTAKENDNGDAIEGSELGKTVQINDTENDDTEDGRTQECRSGKGGNNAENVDDSEAEELNRNEKGEHVDGAEDGTAPETGSDENNENIVCPRTKCAVQKVNTEQACLTNSGDDGKVEDAECSANMIVDVDSSNGGTPENGMADNDVKTNCDTGV